MNTTTKTRATLNFLTKWCKDNLEEIGANHSIYGLENLFKENKETKKYAISKTAIINHKKEFEDIGIIFAIRRKTKERVGYLAKWCKDNLEEIGANHGIYGLENLFKENKETKKYAISTNTIVNHKKKFEDVGIIFTIRYGETKEKVNYLTKWCKDNLKEIGTNHNIRRLENLFKENKETKKYAISYAAITNHKKEFEDVGIIFVIQYEKTKEKVNYLIKWCKDNLEEIGTNHSIYGLENLFKKNKETKKYAVTHEAIRKHIKEFKDVGITFPASEPKEHEKYSTTINSLKKIFKEELISFESHQAFIELASDFYNKEIKLNMLENNIIASPYSQIIEISEDRKIETIQIALDELQSNHDTLYIPQIKFILLKNKIYLEENTILSVLKGLDEDGEIETFEGLKPRIELAKLMISESNTGATFVKELPSINSTNILTLNNKLKSSTYAKGKWEEYCKFIVEHKLITYSGKLELRNQTDELSLLRDTQKEGLFLLPENLELLSEYGIEILSALTLYTKKLYSEKSTPNQLKGFYPRLVGFFVWLYYQDLALLSPRYIQSSGGKNDTLAKVISFFIKQNTNVNTIYAAFKYHSKGANKQHTMQLSHSLKNHIDLKALTNSEANKYLSACEHYATSGNLSHSEYLYNTFKGLNNTLVYRVNKDRTPREYFNKHSNEISTDCLKVYSSFINNSLEVIIDEMGETVVKTNILELLFLLEYIDKIHNGRKLSKKELQDALNPKEIKDGRMGIREWAIHIDGTRHGNPIKRESDMRSMLNLIFDNEDNMYFGIYSSKWLEINTYRPTNSYMGIIRVAYDSIVRREIGKTLLHTPPKSSYSFKRTTIIGEPANLDWWHHDASPIPAIACFLGVKFPWRWIQVRHLDANTFFRTLDGKIDGEFSGFFINTDKNINRSKPYIIDARIVRKILTNNEIETIRSYVKYIQDCYGHLPTCVHDSQKKRYSEIQPLFPHHNKNRVYSKDWLIGYLCKAMLATTIRIKDNMENILKSKENIKEDVFRHETQKEILKLDIVLPKNDMELPSTLDEINNSTDNDFYKNFKPLGGGHSFRHSGITDMVKADWLPSVIISVTGHTSHFTVSTVYTQVNELEVASLIIQASPLIAEELLGNNTPSENGDMFIRKISKHIIESSNPKETQKLLEQNSFIGSTGVIVSGSKDFFGEIGEIEIDNPLEFASHYDPLTQWRPMECGICSIAYNCPGNSMECGSCPLLIMSPMHIEGVIYRLNLSARQIAHYNNKLFKFRQDRKKNNQRISSMEHLQLEEFDNYLGWWEKLSLLKRKISKIVEKIDSSTSILPIAKTEKTTHKLFGYISKISLDEASMDILSRAIKLKAEGFETEDIKVQTLNKMYAVAIRKNEGDLISEQFLENLVGSIGMNPETHYEEIKHLCSEYLSNEPELLENNKNFLEFSPTNNMIKGV